LLFQWFPFYKLGFSQYLAEDLVSGWKWIGRQVDTADFEWKMWTPIFFKWLKFVIPYLIISLTIKRKYPQSVSIISTAMSFCWLWSMLGLQLTVFMFIQPVLFLWILKFFSLAFVWLVCISFTLTLHSSLFSELKVSIDNLELNYYKLFIEVKNRLWMKDRSIWR
jgi:hypothetical protein